MMATFIHSDRPSNLAQFDWVVGPVLACYWLQGTTRYILVQGANAYAVVDFVACNYLGCCPTLALAKRFAAKAA